MIEKREHQDLFNPNYFINLETTIKEGFKILDKICNSKWYYYVNAQMTQIIKLEDYNKVIVEKQKKEKEKARKEKNERMEKEKREAEKEQEIMEREAKKEREKLEKEAEKEKIRKEKESVREQERLKKIEDKLLENSEKKTAKNYRKR